MKIKFRDKVIAVLLLTVFVIYAVFNYVVFPANKEVDKLKEKKEKVEAKQSDIEPLLKETEEKLLQKDKVYEKYDLIKFAEASKTATSEEFLVYIGQSAETNNVKVTGFSDLGNSFEDGIYRACYDIELSGTPFAITHVIQDLDKMGIECSVGSVSFRQDKEYDYLKRFFDTETNLNWYTEPEEEEEPENKEDALAQQPTEQQPIPQAPAEPINPPQTESVKPKPEKNETIHKNEKVEAETVEPGGQQGIVIPDDESIEDRLDELLKLSSFNPYYRIMPLTNTTVITENPYTNEMRLSFTVCLIMFNEPSPETSFISPPESEESEETEEVDEVF